MNGSELDDRAMEIYDYIVNNVATCRGEFPGLADQLREVDLSGQFLASSARFLAAIDKDAFSDAIHYLIEKAIERDRERKYIGALLTAVWGSDYQERVEELNSSDDNFRRIYKRLHCTGI